MDKANIMENKEMLKKQLKFISKFNFNEGRMEKDLLLVNLRELIREHLEKDQEEFLKIYEKYKVSDTCSILYNNKELFLKDMANYYAKLKKDWIMRRTKTEPEKVGR